MDERGPGRDRRLTERIEAGDVTALEELYDAYAPAVYREALAILGCAADAEDVLQEVFLKLVQRRGRPIDALKAYLLTAARHRACSLLREQRRVEPVGDPAAVEAASAYRQEGAPDREAVWEAVQALPADQRQVVVWKIYEQRTFQEIAGMMKASINTVASRYRYALGKLRKALEGTVDV